MKRSPVAVPVAGPVASSTTREFSVVSAALGVLATRTYLHSDRRGDRSTAAAGGLGTPPRRVRTAHVEWVHARLGERDRAIIESVNRLRLLTGQQLERLHFGDLSSPSRSRVRRRVLARLVGWRVLMSLERRIGGVRAGSSGLVFSLDTAGQQLVRQSGANDRPARRADEPSPVLLGHRLGIAELYVQLTELTHLEGFTVAEFVTEPWCWWPNGLGGQLKPDAFLVLGSKGYADAWWLEQDQGTEHLPVIRRKLSAYLEFVARGQVGPTGVVPRVLISVPDEKRMAAVADTIQRMPEPANVLLHVTTHSTAPKYLLGVLRQ